MLRSSTRARCSGRGALVIAGVLCGPRLLLAQQPFVVDDAAVTPAGGAHVEISNRVDVLKASSRPARWQDVLHTEIDVGLPRRIELSFALPFITVVSDGTLAETSTVRGIGDSTLAVKWCATRDPDAGVSWATAGFVQFPTGSSKRGLGSALVDYGFNVVAQARVAAHWTWRGNGGAVLAGNTQTGAVGISVRGPVLLTGVSLVREVGRARVGGETTVAWSRNASLGGSAVGVQIGGNLPVADWMTLDLGVGTGWFAGSPRLSARVGLSADLGPR